MYLYCYLHEHFRLIDLSEQSAWFGLFTALLMDFGYYWIHRANHGNTQKPYCRRLFKVLLYHMICPNTYRN